MKSNKPTIIAFTGAKGSGKNFVGEYLAENIGGVGRAFADPVRNAVKETYNLVSDAEYDTFKRIDHVIMGRSIPGRQLVLGIGMNMREVNPVFPLEYMESCLAEVQSTESHLVIFDTRFDNEVRWVLDNGGIIVKIYPPDEALVQTDTSSNEHRHVAASERGVPDEMCHLVLKNTGIPAFREHVIEALLNLPQFTHHNENSK